jgi:hypothetical protein
MSRAMALLECKEQMEMSCGAIPNVFPRVEHVWRKCRVSSVVPEGASVPTRYLEVNIFRSRMGSSTWDRKGS